MKFNNVFKSSVIKEKVLTLLDEVSEGWIRIHKVVSSFTFVISLFTLYANDDNRIVEHYFDYLFGALFIALSYWGLVLIGAWILIGFKKINET